jgi:hypothetical protein
MDKSCVCVYVRACVCVYVLIYSHVLSNDDNVLMGSVSRNNLVG